MGSNPSMVERPMTPVCGLQKVPRSQCMEGRPVQSLADLLNRCDIAESLGRPGQLSVTGRSGREERPTQKENPGDPQRGPCKYPAEYCAVHVWGAEHPRLSVRETSTYADMRLGYCLFPSAKLEDLIIYRTLARLLTRVLLQHWGITSSHLNTALVPLNKCQNQDPKGSSCF